MAAELEEVMERDDVVLVGVILAALFSGMTFVYTFIADHELGDLRERVERIEQRWDAYNAQEEK